jgi:hypothetical protein
LGEKALDRSEEIKHRYPPTSSAALTESSRRAGIDLCAAFAAPVACVSPWKYRTQRRKDQLQADMRVLTIAATLFVDHPVDSLQRWNALLLPRFHVSVWDFPTANLKTPMQRVCSP